MARVGDVMVVIHEVMQNWLNGLRSFIESKSCGRQSRKGMGKHGVDKPY